MEAYVCKLVHQLREPISKYVETGATGLILMAALETAGTLSARHCTDHVMHAPPLQPFSA